MTDLKWTRGRDYHTEAVLPGGVEYEARIWKVGKSWVLHESTFGRPLGPVNGQLFDTLRSAKAWVESSAANLTFTN